MDSVLDRFFGEFHYLAPFTVLLLCGLGLPLPEEVSLIGSGLLVHQGKVDFTIVTLVCSAAILIGDAVPYWLGRRFGLHALRVKWVARVLHPERFALLQRRFEEHGNWAIFTCRFLPGLRIPGYFTAGTLGMSYPRFLLLDALGVLISVPVSIYLGRLFGERIELLTSRVENLHQILGFAILSLMLIMFVRARGRRRDREAAEVSAGTTAGTTAGTEAGAEAGVQAEVRADGSPADGQTQED